ncbi:4-coumarate-CoA ligase [Ilyonectria sp. MPI-CAGE-AT-0026]|nr:4-coumarate-CoA ligase [Ilyonectria sp. MPI-CAGE-AT-0026]
MPIQSRFTTLVPEVSLQKWVFDSSFCALPDVKAFIDSDNPHERFLTLSDFRLLSKRVALGLQKAGLHPGDRVLLFSGNSIFFPPIFMGILMAGGIFTGASPAFGSRELAHQLKDSGATLAIAGRSTLPVVLGAASQSGLPSSSIYAFDHSLSAVDENNPRGIKHWSCLLADIEEAERFDWVEPADPRTTSCCLNYSSGTTGLPKGVEITHYAYVANGEACIRLNLMDPYWSEKAGAKRSLCFLPLYHAAGQTTFVANNPKMRIPTYIMQAYNFNKVLRHVQDFKISDLGTAPQVVLQIAKSPLTDKYDLSSITDVICGTAPLSSEIAEAAEKKLWPNGGNFIRQGWSMTEVTCSGALWSHDDGVRTSSVGEIVPNAVFQIRNGDVEVTEPNKPGELWFSGPTLMKGYWCNPRATAETIIKENGIRWLKTGDFAYVDRHGPGAKIFIVDRLKELIKVRGFQGVLLERDDVVDAGVVGIQVNGAEVPRAYIVKNSAVTEQEITKWIEEKGGDLRGGIAFVDSIPRTQSGKIIRRVLREWAARELGGQLIVVPVEELFKAIDYVAILSPPEGICESTYL